MFSAISVHVLVVQVESLVKEVAAHEDKVEGLKKELRRQARDASQMEKKVHYYHVSLYLDNTSPKHKF